MSSGSIFSKASLERARDDLEGPLDRVRGLPNDAFSWEAFFAMERERLFRRTWVLAGRRA